MLDDSKAERENDPSEMENRIDDISINQHLKIAGEDEHETDLATLNVAANKIERLIPARRAMLKDV